MAKMRKEKNNFIIRPVRYVEAARFVKRNHTLRSAPAGHLFSIGAYDGERLFAVCMCGIPPNQYLNDGVTLYGSRLAKTGNIKNIDSFLFSKIIRIAQILNYERVITYTSIEETGQVERSLGFHIDGFSRSSSKKYTFKKIRWVRFLKGS